ncbi:MAG: bifunctional UDP-N-acetylmuramoyl-tripeptide:D-alanyl-D-alanine ligase/alanine racemase [Prevotellaceae bacterium]|nr:bifunctional UDP-N-acetylmuramoyl-tripeptide:D-alanyl-D-alanine ligase/alanine racemase [Candidatus Colivivens equi]
MMYKISDIAQIIGAERRGSEDAEINWLLIDSRSLCFAEQTLFFAIKTNKNDGHKYIEELYRRGVRNFVVHEVPFQMEGYKLCNFLVVEDTLTALQALAAYNRQQYDIPVIAITGSNGKTTVKEWLYQILSPDLNVCRSPRSYNSQYGVPLSLWLIGKNNDIAIIEAGISFPGEMAKLKRIIRPTLGVFTNIGQAHQENFMSIEQKYNEKMTLFTQCEKVITPELLEIIQISKTENRATIICKTKNVDDNTEYKYTIPFIDNAAIENSLTCLATCITLQLKFPNISIQNILSRFSSLEPVAMRLEVKDGKNGCTLINDTYNSDIHSLDIALDFMSRRPDTKGQTRTLILSDILQSGESPRTLYKHVAEMAENRGIQKFIGVGEQICSCAEYFSIEHYFFKTTEELLSSDVFNSLYNEFILIKGARQFRFDYISDLLTLKVHQTILEIDLKAMIDNVNYYKSYLQPDTKMVCMVKASAYGIGALETSKTLQDQGIDYLAVAVADEGVELRKAGITSSIMIMNPELTSFKMLFDYKLEPEVYNFQLLEALITFAEKEGITNFPIHIKIDTGMHRLGFNAQTDMTRLIQRLSRQNALVPCSVFSHFVGSDSFEFDDFSRQQFAIFDAASEKLQQAYSHKILRHICNSAGIEHFPRYHMDMVRLGLGLYGINPRDNSIINNVATLKTTILQIRDVPAGDSIGYSRKSFVECDSRIAAIPIGYADGLNRRLGNRNCYCLVNNQKAPYVGNICMDVCMIDVTDIDCKEGDPVIIFGENLPVTILSDAIGTIPYEILTGISTRVQRVYVQE